jgi:glucose/arabinose dehydrogenase
MVTDYRDLPVAAAEVTSIIAGLDAPWGFAFLGQDDFLVTERFGTLRRVRNGTLSEPLSGVPTVISAGQGGLLDVSPHPEYPDNNLIYLSYVVGTTEANRLQVARAELVGSYF